MQARGRVRKVNGDDLLGTEEQYRRGGGLFAPDRVDEVATSAMAPRLPLPGQRLVDRERAVRAPCSMRSGALSTGDRPGSLALSSQHRRSVRFSGALSTRYRSGSLALSAQEVGLVLWRSQHKIGLVLWCSQHKISLVLWRSGAVSTGAWPGC